MNVLPEDTNWYEIVIANEYGKTSSKAYLQVLDFVLFHLFFS